MSTHRRTSDLAGPIRTLGEHHRARIASHLKELDAQDRYYRFGFVVDDDQIEHYLSSMNFHRDEIFGIYNRSLKLITVAHLAYAGDGPLPECAAFGVSVLPHARRRGFGQRLFERAATRLSNHGARRLFLQVLSENTPMLNIARQAGATVALDVSESEARLELTPPTLNTQVSEMLEEHMAQTDYQLKIQAKQFHDLMAALSVSWLPPSSDR